MKQLTTKLTAIVFGLTLLLGANLAHAALELSLSDGTNSVLVTGAGGVVSFNGALPGGSVFTVNVTTGLSKPIETGNPIMDLNSVNVSTSGAGTLTIMVTDQGFTGSVGSSLFSQHIGGTLSAGAATLVANAMVDPTNTLFGGSAVCSPAMTFNNPSATTVAFSGSCSGSGSTSGAYSITLKDVITFTGNGTVSFDHAIVPEPSAMLLFGTGLLGLVGWMRRRKA